MHCCNQDVVGKDGRRKEKEKEEEKEGGKVSLIKGRRRRENPVSFEKVKAPTFMPGGRRSLLFPISIFFVPLGDIKRWSGTDGPSLVFLRPESHWNYQGRGTGASSTRVFGIHAVRNFYCI